MAFYGEDIPTQDLIPQVKQLFQQQTTYVQPSTVDNQAPSDGTFQAPIKGSWRSSGGFDPVSIRPNGRKGHMGVDMRAPAGTPIYPLAPGVVSSVGTDPLGGNVVNVQHANGVRTYYAHMSVVKAQKGDKVDKDTVLGNVGQTGNAVHTVPHLHFQVWKDSQIQDPAHYFSVPPYMPLQPGEKTWLSDEAKQEAQAFNMQQHVSERRVAFSREVAKLHKLAALFDSLVSRQL